MTNTLSKEYIIRRGIHAVGDDRIEDSTQHVPLIRFRSAAITIREEGSGLDCGTGTGVSLPATELSTSRGASHVAFAVDSFAPRLEFFFNGTAIL